MARCNAKTRTGDQCRKNAIRGAQHCYLSTHGGSSSPFVKRAANFLVNHSFWPVTGVILALIPLGFYFRDQRRQATSGILSGSQKAVERPVLLGGVPMSFRSEDGVI